MVTQGKKQIREAVIIAALCTIATGAVNMGFRYAEEAIEAKRKRQKKAKKKAKSE